MLFVDNKIQSNVKIEQIGLHTHTCTQCLDVGVNADVYVSVKWKGTNDMSER